MNITGFSYPPVDLSMYAPNFTGKCAISYYEPEKNIQDSIVCIVDVERPFEVDLCSEKGHAIQELPPPGEVFLVDLGEDGFHRAVRHANDTTSIYFIDIGYIMELKSQDDLEMFALSERARKMSARAISCEVVKVVDEYGNQIDDLEGMFNDEVVLFTVHQVERDRLKVILQKSAPERAEKENSHEQLTQEQIDILYEEPEMVTTNALKAVLGYVPHDDSRICQFYDPATGGCFKGNACRLEHVPPLMDTTRDQKKVPHILEPILPMIGSTYKVCVTCIVSAEKFYVHIPQISAQGICGSVENLKQKINSDDMVGKYKPQTGVPDLLELVLIRRKDIFYRGKVLDNFEDHCVIFFIDYGYTENVYTKDIFEWHPRWTIIPAQAYSCFFENIRVSSSQENTTKQILRNFICNISEVSAKIIGISDEMYVRLYDEGGYDIGETLCAQGLAENNSRLVPVAGLLPG